MRNSISSILRLFAKTSLLISLVVFSSVLGAQAQNAAEGESLFKQKCTACHAIDQQVVGPALKGVETRHTEEWIIKWVKDSQALVKSGDKEAVALFDKFNKVPMTAFPDLTDDNIKNILAYIKSGGASTAKPAAAVATATQQASDSGLSNLTIVLLVLVVALALVLVIVLNKVVTSLEALLMEKQGFTQEQIAETTAYSKFKKKLKNKKFVFFLALIFLVIFGGLAVDYLWNVGVHTGYKPEQPIKYSHELHAGTNKIDCRYCHSGAYKSKNASIPSANVCMNCHKYVQAKDKYDGQISPEIKKIYAALDYDPETMTYGTNQKPIKWIRVHNLPDFAYFNHSQHVKVAGVKCQKCHGPIETMKEVYQYSPLTMKWCVNCHRETDVNVKGNAYYDKLLAYHDILKKGGKVKVATIGGLECGKCHY